MKKVISVFLAFLILMLPAVAEQATNSETMEEIYDRIEMSKTKAELDDAFECAETEDGYFLYENSVLCAFYESGRLQAKTRVFESICDAAPVADIPLSKLSSYKQGMTMDEVTKAFGAEGLEIMRINLADEENAGQRRVLAWQTDAGIAVQALFELDDNEWVLFAIAEVK